MYRHLFKRVFDIIIGLLAFPFVLLFICVLGSIIYLSDKGTIFYKAKRIEQIWSNITKNIFNRYSAESVAKKTSRLYEWVLGKCGKPDFVYTI